MVMENITNLYEHGPADSDLGFFHWKNGNKSFSFYLTIYGDITTIRAGLTNPARGTVLFHKFEDGWKWFCDPKEELPPHTCMQCYKEVTICNSDGIAICRNCGCEMKFYGNIVKD